MKFTANTSEDKTSLEWLGDAMDYLYWEKGTQKLWSLSRPSKSVDEGDRLAFVLLRERFAKEIQQ